MRCTSTFIRAIIFLVIMAGGAFAQSPEKPGTEEFGLTPRQLNQNIERVEALISKCMREQGFQYVAADYLTVRRGMRADKVMPGMSEETFIKKFGFGISTLYTGNPPQLAEGYSPGREGLGEKNIRIYRGLSTADRVAYNRALFGENVGATFSVGLEAEDFSHTGGCTRQAIEQVFDSEQVKASYYNPMDTLIRKDPRMQAALRKYAAEMRKAGFTYNHPDDIEPDIRQQLAALTEGQTLVVEKMSSEKRAALKQLQDYERRVAKINLDLEEDVFGPVEEKIEEEMYARKIE